MKYISFKKVQSYMLSFVMLIVSASILLFNPTYSKYQSTNNVGEISLTVLPPSIEVYAIYSDTDYSLRIFNRKEMPKLGDTIETSDGEEIVVTNLYFNFITSKTIPWDDKKTSIEKIVCEDKFAPTDIADWFNDCSNATYCDLSNLNTSNISDMSNMFDNCSALETLKLGKNFGNTGQTFSDIGLNKVITGWTKESENDETDHLCQNITLGVEETYSAVTYCYATYSASTGTHTLQIYQRKYVPAVNERFNDGFSSYTVSAVFSWRRGTTASNYTVSEGCRPPRKFSDNSIYTSWGGFSSGTSIFYSVKVRDYCAPQSLNGWFRSFQNLGNNNAVIDLEKLDTSQATSMSYMFYDCNKPTSLDLSHFDTSNVTSMSYMFSKCFNLTNLDLSSFDTSKVTNMASMFDMTSSTGLYTSSLKTIYVSDNFVTINVTSSAKMFTSCINLVGGNKTTFTENSVDKTYARIDKEGQQGYFTEKVAA